MCKLIVQTFIVHQQTNVSVWQYFFDLRMTLEARPEGYQGLRVRVCTKSAESGREVVSHRILAVSRVTRIRK